MRRASVPSVPKKLDHNELGACESVPEGVLASVPGSGPGDHETKRPPGEEDRRQRNHQWIRTDTNGNREGTAGWESGEGRGERAVSGDVGPARFGYFTLLSAAGCGGIKPTRRQGCQRSQT